jgi:hypothetical protein
MVPHESVVSFESEFTVLIWNTVTQVEVINVDFYQLVKRCEVKIGARLSDNAKTEMIPYATPLVAPCAILYTAR